MQRYVLYVQIFTYTHIQVYIHIYILYNYTFTYIHIYIIIYIYLHTTYKSPEMWTGLFYEGLLQMLAWAHSERDGWSAWVSLGLGWR